jgi:hypothetical protein
MDDNLLAPRRAAVGAPLLQEVEVAVIAGAVASPFAERQQVAVRCSDDRWNAVNAVCVEAPFPRRPHSRHLGLVLGRCERTQQQQCSAAPYDSHGEPLYSPNQYARFNRNSPLPDSPPNVAVLPQPVCIRSNSRP